MTSYLLLIHGAETDLESMSESDLEAMMATHDRFTEALATRGHAIVAAADLTPSREGVTLRGPGAITEGPYAEATEQIGGFYFVDTEDRADFLECARILAEVHPDLEIRAAADHGAAE